MIYLGHVLLSQAVHAPEFRLDPKEAKELSAASMNVMRHYGSSILSEKTQDWIKFGMVACAVYVPRLGKMNERKRASKRGPVSGPGPETEPSGPTQNQPPIYSQGTV